MGSRRDGEDIGAVIVRDQGGGPRFYGKWRDPSAPGRQVERSIGAAWVVRIGEPGARPNGRTVGGRWRERAGQPQGDRLTVRQAERRLPAVFEAWQREQAESEIERRRLERGGEGRTVCDAAEAWVEAGGRGALATQRGQPWKHSWANNAGHYAGRISRELGHQALISIDADRLESFLDSLRPERNGEPIGDAASQRMRATYVGALRGIFAHAARRGWIESDPASGLEAHRPKRSAADPLRDHEYLTADQVRAVAAEAREGYRHDASTRNLARRWQLKVQSDADAAMVLTAAMAGLREGELIALRWRDVDFEASSIRVREARTLGHTDVPKSGHGRAVPMAPEVAQALAKLSLRGYGTDPGDLVFLGLRGAHVDIAAFRDRYYDAQSRAGVEPRRTVHELRHTFGTVMAAHGVPLRTLQHWLGHESIATTERYSAFVPRHDDAAVVSAAFAGADPAA